MILLKIINPTNYNFNYATTIFNVNAGNWFGHLGTKCQCSKLHWLWHWALMH